MDESINISVIIPHYNDLERLKRCIDSVPKKQDVEILVIDDQSPEDVQKKLKEYVANQDCGLRLFVNPNENHNAGTCRNIGLDNAKGKWVLFADADDYFTKDAFDTIGNYLDSEKDVIFFGVTSVFEETGEESTRHIVAKREVEGYYNNPERKEELLLRMGVTPWAKLIKRAFVEQYHIRSEEIRYSNDVMLSTQIGCLAEEIGVDPRVVYCVTDSKGTLTKIKNRDSSEIRNKAFLRRYIFWYQHISRKEMRLAGMRLYGIRSVLNPIKNNKDWKSAKNNIKLLIKEKVPIFF